MKGRPPKTGDPIPDGLTLESWAAIGARRDQNRWLIPERNCHGEVVGWSVRADDGDKSFVKGGHRGLVLNWSLDRFAGATNANPIYIVEGASDTAAGIDLGLDIVGRPSADGGAEHLAELLKGLHICFIADNDKAGRAGAIRVATKLHEVAASIRIINPPPEVKDLRAWLIGGATKATVVQALDNAPLFTPPASPDASRNAFTPIQANSLIDQFPQMRSAVIDGLLRQGEVMNIIAATKVGKSWLALSLALAIVTGRSWFGMATAQGRVLLIDAELHEETLARRIAKAAEMMGIPKEALSALDIWPVRGKRLTIDQVQDLLNGVPAGTYRAIVLDALYRFFPTEGEENANELMTRVYNTLDAICATTQASMVVVHHTTKGDQWGKAITDIGAGGGAQSRATDTHLVVKPHEVENAAVIEAATRSWRKPQPFVIRWTDPGWELAPDLDPADLKRRPARSAGSARAPAATPTPQRPWSPERFAVEIVGPKHSIKEDIIARAKETGMSRTFAESLLKRALESGSVYRHIPSGNKPHRFTTLPTEVLRNTG